MLVIDSHHGSRTGDKRDAWRDPVALQPNTATEAVCILEYAIQTERQCRRQWLVHVRAEPAIAVGARLQHRLTGPLKAGMFGNAVDDPATATATEHHAVRSLERFDPLDVVEVTVVLHIVAHAVDIEVRG